VFSRLTKLGTGLLVLSLTTGLTMLPQVQAANSSDNVVEEFEQYQNAHQDLPIKKMVNQFLVDHAKKKKHSKDAYKNGLEKAKEIEKILEMESNDASVQSAFDDNWWKLRSGNLIESVLDADEGMDTSEILDLFDAADTARDAAEDKYPNDEMLEDAYRHFAWNHIASRDIGTSATETGTTNHEWGLLLLDPISNYYRNQYNDYIIDNYTEEEAAEMAYGDAINEISPMKADLVAIFRSSYSVFKGYLEVGNIMDLNNNYYGRYYSSTYSSYDTAFTVAKNANYLILSESSVTDTHYRKVWNNRWYY